MATIVGKLQAILGLNTKEFEQGMGRAKTQTGDFKSQLTKIAGTLGVAFGVKEIGQFALEASKLAGAFEGVVNAFDRLNRPDILDKMRKATRGAVSDLELMQQAVMARNFRIPLDVMAQGLEFATIRAKETGQAIDFLVNSFVVGMGRKSIMILDNLGLSMREIQEEVKKTGDFNEAIGVIMQRELAAAGTQVETTAESYAAFSAEVQNLTVNVGQLVNSLLNVQEELKGQESLLERFNFLVDFWQDKYGVASKSVVAGFMDILNAEEDVLRQQELLDAEIDRYNQLLDGTFVGLEDNNKASKQQAQTYLEILILLGNINLEIDDYKIALEAATEASKKARAAEKLLNDIYESRAELWQNQFGGLGFGDITAGGDGDLFDPSLVPALDEEALDPEPYIEFSETMAAQAEGLVSAMDFYNKQLVSSFVGMAESIGATLGEMIAVGEAGFSDFLKIAIDFAKQFAGIMIALGIAKNALIPGSGIKQIAAGLALGVVASGAGAFMATKEQQQSMNVTVTGELDGRKMNIINKRGNEMHAGVT